ncbi:MAG TPA: hypothetical protein VJL85_06585 [Gaiellaceae bacterium]|nr:hypothetical protein [Gaiellaceae bacterium]
MIKRVIALRIYRIRLLALVALAIVAATSGGGFFDGEILVP